MIDRDYVKNVLSEKSKFHLFDMFDDVKDQLERTVQEELSKEYSGIEVLLSSPNKQDLIFDIKYETKLYRFVSMFHNNIQ